MRRWGLRGRGEEPWEPAYGALGGEDGDDGGEREQRCVDPLRLLQQAEAEAEAEAEVAVAVAVAAEDGRRWGSEEQRARRTSFLIGSAEAPEMDIFLSGTALDFLDDSIPARSQSVSRPKGLPFWSITWIATMPCPRDERGFIAIAAITRLPSPTLTCAITSLTVVTFTNLSPSGTTAAPCGGQQGARRRRGRRGAGAARVERRSWAWAGRQDERGAAPPAQ